MSATASGAAARTRLPAPPPPPLDARAVVVAAACEESSRLSILFCVAGSRLALLAQRAAVRRQMARVIIGLGNYGPGFGETRHNVGFKVLDRLLQATQSPPLARASSLHDASVTSSGTLVVRPRLFMNETGRVLGALGAAVGGPLCVVHDELEVALGQARVKRNGSAKGHNGVKSLAQCRGGSLDFARVQVGIGRPASRDAAAVASYVLGKFTPAERELLEQGLDAAVDLLVKEFIASRAA